MSTTPSLGDLTFEVDLRREWTPPHVESLEAKLFESPRTASAYLSSNPYRSSNYVRPSGRTTPDVRAPDAAKPQGQPQSQPQPQLVTPAHAPPASAELGRISTPRRPSPTRVVCIEPSLSQLPSASPSELPSIRGQTLAFAAPSAVSSGNINSAAAVYGGTTSARRGLAAQGSPMSLQGATGAGGTAGSGSLMPDHVSNMSSHQGPDPVDTYLVRFQLHQRIRDGFRVRQDEHLRTVQELGAKIQAMIRPGSPKSASDKDKEAEAATATAAATSSSIGQAEAGEGSEQAASAAAGAVREEGTLEREGSTSETPAAAAAAAPASPSASAAAVMLSPFACRGSPPRVVVANAAVPPPLLPDPPLGRNRFVPLPLALAAGGLGDRRHSSTSANGDLSPRSPGPLLRAGSARPAAGDGAAAATTTTTTTTAATVEAHLQAGGSVSQLQSQLLLAHQLQNQGAYLALPDGSFAGTAPFRAQSTTEGLLFERYRMRKGQAAAGPVTADLPDLQLRYIRPPTTAPLEPKVLKKLPRPPQPPIRALPNGIPASRLESLSARRRNRSPQRPFQQLLQSSQQLQSPPRSELIFLSGATAWPHTAPASLSGGGGGVSGSGGGGLLNSPAALEDGLLRSISMLGSPTTTTTAHGGTLAGSAAAAAAVPYGRNHLVTAMVAAGAAGGEGRSALAQYLAVPTAPSTGEPLLDDNFYEVLSQHFRSSLHQQTAHLRAQLNVNLPVVLKALNCVNVTEPLPPPAPLAPAPGAAAATAAAVASPGAAAGGGAVASRLAR